MLAVEPDQQEAIAKQVVGEDLTVRQLEKQIRAGAKDGEDAKEKASPSAGSTKDPAVLELELLLSERLATRVGVTTGKPGKIAIDYADLDDLERIYHIIAGQQAQD